MKIFSRVPKLGLPLIDRKVVDSKRFYITPLGDFPSITTILGSEENPFLDSWKTAVGEKEATRITSQAGRRGTLFHSLSESYLSNEPIDYAALMPDMKVNFKRFTNVLDRINNIYYLEQALYSWSLRIAGTCDCIAEFDGVLSVIDFKTSRRSKEVKDIQSYFEQETAYVLMYYHMTGEFIPQIVTLMMEDYSSECKVFIEKPVNHIVSLKKKIAKFMETNNVS